MALFFCLNHQDKMWATKHALLLGVFAIATRANESPKAELRDTLGEVLGGGDKAVSACMASAKTPAEQKACRFGSTVKDQIAASSGKKSTEIDDAYVSNLLNKNSQKRIATEMKNCSGKTACWDQARRAAADALGVKKRRHRRFHIEKKYGRCWKLGVQRNDGKLFCRRQ